MSGKLRVLFITKDYPPHLGGMAQYSKDMYCNVSRLIEMDLVRHSGGKKSIPLFAIRAFFLALTRQHRWDAIHASCGMLAPIAWGLKTLTGKPATVTVHGLDITRKNWLYRFVVPWCLRRIDHVVCVSNHTKCLCEQRGVNEQRIAVIPNGIDFDNYALDPTAKDEWRQNFGTQRGKKLLFTIGNLTRRKGQLWFINEVLAKLDREDYQYYLIGQGKDRSLLEETIATNNLGATVKVTGAIDRRDVDAFYKYGDLYVMPNIPIEGDVEGFGIVAIEAGASGIPVLTSGIEGIADAVIFGTTGVSYDNAADAARKVSRFLDDESLASDRDVIMAMVLEKYNWRDIAERYSRLFSEVARKTPGVS